MLGEEISFLFKSRFLGMPKKQLEVAPQLEKWFTSFGMVPISPALGMVLTVPTAPPGTGWELVLPISCSAELVEKHIPLL